MLESCQRLPARHYAYNYADPRHSQSRFHLKLANKRFHPYHFVRGVHVPELSGATSHSFRAVAQAYGWPIDQFDGSGRSCAFLELGGGYTHSDAALAAAQAGIAVPDVEVVLVAGGSNTPDGPDGADGEVALDVQASAALAPKAKYYVLFGPNSFEGILECILKAIELKVDCLSISWGAAEDQFTEDERSKIDKALQLCVAGGITVIAVSGDSGSSDGERGLHVDFLASSPWVLSCGGTTLRIHNGFRQSEIVWAGSGGGYSAFYQKPSWQAGNTAAMRLVPDVAGNANPQTGYPVYVDGKLQVIGGTSAVAPMYAALTMLLRQSGQKIGWWNPLLYQTPELCFDVTSGSNGRWQAGVGLDPCTGLGVYGNTYAPAATPHKYSPGQRVKFVGSESPLVVMTQIMEYTGSGDPLVAYRLIDHASRARRESIAYEIELQ